MSFDFPASVENQDDEALAFRAEIRMSDNVRVPVIACFLRRVAFVKVDWQRAFPKGDDFEFLGDELTHNWRSCSLPLAPEKKPGRAGSLATGARGCSRLELRPAGRSAFECSRLRKPKAYYCAS